MYAIYTYIGVVWGVNVGIYGSPMECLGFVLSSLHGPPFSYRTVRFGSDWGGCQGPVIPNLRRYDWRCRDLCLSCFVCLFSLSLSLSSLERERWTKQAVAFGDQQTLKLWCDFMCVFKPCGQLTIRNHVEQ